jgi:hypothetical protein
MPRSGHNYGVHASDEMAAAAAAYRVRSLPGDAELADLLEETARKAAAREGIWQLAGYSPQEQMQLAECWWRNELAIARALLPSSG